MFTASCPYCKQSDGGDDIIVSKKLVHADYSGAQVVETRICDICGKIYECSKNYKFSYETYGHEPFDN